MPVIRVALSVVLGCASLSIGCRGGPANCPVATITADPEEIPDGLSETLLSIDVLNPLPNGDLHVVTELTSSIGGGGPFGDPFALATTYACAHDVSGPVEICVNATYVEDDDDGALSEVFGVGSAQEYIRPSHIRIQDPLECSRTKCIEITCPEDRNTCPVVSSFTVEPAVVPEGGAATIEVDAEDPDDNPEALTTTTTARHGTIADPHARVTTYQCDPDVGGVIEICVSASDGDASCDVERCTTVRCPGDPLENTCPIIESFAATPMMIPAGETMTDVRVVAIDPDDFPVPLRIELSSETGVFGDRFAAETTFTCGDSGPVELCVKANDGDPECDETQCIIVQCPSDIPANLCPQLFVINGIPRVIPEGQTSTRVETRGQDTDGLPFPLTLTLSALWGSFEDTENIQEPFNVVAQDATYICDRPGQVEVCVDATDGACTKTQCDRIICPSTIPPP